MGGFWVKRTTNYLASGPYPADRNLIQRAVCGQWSVRLADNGQLERNERLFGEWAGAGSSQAKLTEMGETPTGHAPGDERYDGPARPLQSAAQVLKLYDGVLTKATTELGRL